MVAHELTTWIYDLKMVKIILKCYYYLKYLCYFTNENGDEIEENLEELNLNMDSVYLHYSCSDF